jgi:hypothetical protein
MEAENQARVGIVVTSADLVSESGKILEKNTLIDEHIPAKEARERLLKSDFITACSALVPISVMKEAGEFDKDLRGVDEYDVWLRITKKYDVLTLSEPLCAWTKTETNISGDKAKLYLQNEKIFDRLEAEEDLNAVRVGHQKNLNRILAASLLENNQEALGVVLKKLGERKVSTKVRVMMKLAGFSQPLARFFVRLLKMLGVVNV